MSVVEVVAPEVEIDASDDPPLAHYAGWDYHTAACGAFIAHVKATHPYKVCQACKDAYQADYAELLTLSKR